MFGGLHAYISLLGVVGGCDLRSRIVELPAGGVVTFRLDPSEQADYVLAYSFRGPGIGTNVTWELLEPPTAGVYDVTDDDYEVALGTSSGNLEIRFTNTSAVALRLQIAMARFKAGQLEDLRCLMGFAQPGAVSS